MALLEQLLMEFPANRPADGLAFEFANAIRGEMRRCKFDELEVDGDRIVFRGTKRDIASPLWNGKRGTHVTIDAYPTATGATVRAVGGVPYRALALFVGIHPDVEAPKDRRMRALRAEVAEVLMTAR